MTRIKYVSVVEIDGHGGQIRRGKVDREGSELAIPTPENDREGFDRRTWERVGVFQLPREMPKSEFKEWWNERKDDDPRPDVIDDVIEAVDAADERQQAESGGVEA